MTATDLCAAVDDVELSTFRAVVDAAQEGVIVASPDGDVLYANPAHQTLFGRSFRHWDELLEHYPAADRHVIEQEAAAALRKGASWEGVLQAKGGEGRIFPLWHRAGTVRGNDGGARFTFWFMQDRTGQKQVEDELVRAKEAAERANQAKSRFLAAASHDLRQPLQALAMFVEVLANREHSPQDVKLIERIRDAVAATDMLLSSLLDISKLEAGVVVPAVSAFNAQTVLERLRGEFEPQVAAAGLRLRVLPCALAVRSDQALLERILRNLLTNAIRYTEKGGILLGCRRRGNRLRFEVWDTGSGIPADQMKAIFKEFHQLGNPQRDRRQGLGLGLAIVERLGRLLDHEVLVRSTLHKGSVFAVEVPLAHPPVHKPKPVQLDLTIDNGRSMIAVIDDEPDVLDGLKLLLESWGHPVVTASSGEAAAAELLRRQLVPQLIIADYRLRNGSTGGQAIARMRMLLKAQVPAIILTGDTAPERLRMAKANGHGLLHKPVQAAELRSAIDAALARTGGPARGPRPRRATARH